MDRYKKTSSATPAKVGGYRPKKIIGPWRNWLLVRMKAKVSKNPFAHLSSIGLTWPDAGLPGSGYSRV